MLRFEVYQARDSNWRWRLVANNGRIIADSGEGYASEYNAVRAAKRTKELAPMVAVKRLNGTILSEAKMAGPGFAADPF